MKFFTRLSTSFLLVAAAFIILVMNVGYPNHRFIAFSIYLLSWIPFVLSLRAKKEWLRKHRDRLKQKARPYLPHIIIAILFLLIAYIGNVLVPLERTPLTQMDDAQLTQDMRDDQKTVLFLHRNMTNTVHQLSRIIQAHRGQKALQPADRKLLLSTWQAFLQLSFELEILIDKYKGFYQLNYLTRKQQHVDAFLLAFFSYVTQYGSTLQLTREIDEDPLLQKLLDEPGEHITKNTYYKMKQRLTHPDSLLRLNAGRSYLKLINKDLKGRDAWLTPTRHTLHRIDHDFLKKPEIMLKIPLQKLEKLAFKGWFPIQKNIALQMSYIRAKNQAFFITPDTLQKYRDTLRPGDILLERKNWYATNIGIPGFWPHVALYMGRPDEMDTYFKDLPELTNTTASAVLQTRFPHLRDKWLSPDERGFSICVIEARRPGVIFNSLETSASCDCLSVLRPRVSLADKFKAILNAMEHYGKPYDYNFDFVTDQELVCSELVYKSYLGAEGFNIKPILVNGRTLLPPNRFAQVFAEEYESPNRSFDLVLFLDSIEKKKTVEKKGVEAFVKSWNRPKWYIWMQ